MWKHVRIRGREHIIAAAGALSFLILGMGSIALESEDPVRREVVEQARQIQAHLRAGPSLLDPAAVADRDVGAMWRNTVRPLPGIPWMAYRPPDVRIVRKSADPPPPALAPRWIAVTPRQGAVDLEWSLDPPGAALPPEFTYVLQRRGPADPDFSPIARTTASRYEDSTVRPGKVYTYRLLACAADPSTELPPLGLTEEVRTQVPRDVRLTLRGVLQVDGALRANLEVEKYSDGTWVRRQVPVGVGDAIGRIEKKWDPREGCRTVDGRTGYVVVGIDEVTTQGFEDRTEPVFGPRGEITGRRVVRIPKTDRVWVVTCRNEEGDEISVGR